MEIIQEIGIIIELIIFVAILVISLGEMEPPIKIVKSLLDRLTIFGKLIIVPMMIGPMIVLCVLQITIMVLAKSLIILEKLIIKEKKD